MKHTITKTEKIEVEITSFPAYFRFGDSDFQFAKVISPKQVVYACYSEYATTNRIEVREWLGDTFVPCEPHLFYQTFAKAKALIDSCVQIEHLELQEVPND